MWGRQAGLMGTIALVIGSMFAGSQPRGAAMLSPDSRPKEAWQDGIKGGLLEFDAEDNLVSTNPNAADLFGLDQAIGRVRLGNLLDFNKERQEDLSAFAALARRQGKPQSLRLTLPGRENDLTHLDMYLTPLTSKGLILHAVDRTDDESRIETLRRSQNSAQRDSEDKTLFFAGVSHELRTPLNAIIGFSDMMRSRLFGPLPGKYAEYADLIHDSGQHMLDLIGDVLDLSKVEAGKYELHYDHFDASDVVRSSVKMIRPAADAAQVVLDVDLPHDTGVLVQADRRAVRQILLNLLSNAVKFSNKGGHISVSAAQAASNLILSVGDEGPGMSADEIARIGEPYAQGAQSNMVNERGTGLGLSLVKSLTELHGGSMDIESALGAGTTVKISLPLEAS
jgi:cell cycle sensor histidine kinase DivJ